MKTFKSLFSLLLLAIVFSGCIEEKCESELTYTVYKPVYLEESQFRVNIEAEAARELCRTGAFYVYGDYLFITEQEEGMHIFDNANPENPVAISFLPVGGIVGLAVRNDILYVNNYYDLVTFSLDDPTAPDMLHRTEYAFDTYGVFNASGLNNRVVTEYIETDETVTISCSDARWGRGCFVDATTNAFFAADCDIRRQSSFGIADAAFANGSIGESSSNSGASAGGQDQVLGFGGSLARFTFTNNTLYVVNESQLEAFDLSDPARPQEAGVVQLNWGVETIFPAGDELYIGTTTGMHIMDASDPLNPELLSTMEHVRSCDPVVVSGDRAYVTLRGGTNCGGFTNQLEVVDITDKRNPERVQIVQMNGPVGLSVGNDKLFVCEPGRGMSIFELDEEGMPMESVTLVEELDDARDVIGLHADRHLITIGELGAEQVRYSDTNEITYLSSLEICND
ncbi:hypothetical protein CEQ90_03655 [Lewinellaceae bacterium SD302]|nr:hypothetical protein CEQ90_03655 [Lewinellaceae bacterium SD302]